MTPLPLTSSQQNAIHAFKAFLSGPEQVFMLKGAAGTGKTTIISEFLRILEGAQHDYKLMAPTGRAAYIIGNKTGKDATTIHRGIYTLNNLKSTSSNKGSEDDGGLHANFALRRNDAPKSTVYIVDESSMVSDSFSEDEAFSFGSGRLLADLFEYAGGRKIIFVGDYAQLPPVGMKFSPALDKEYVERTFDCKATEVFLLETVRQQSDSAILCNANRIRLGIESKTFIEFKMENGNDTMAEDYDLLQPYFALSEARPDFNSAIIAYSNRQALQYNLAVRRHYFGENAQRLMPGDLLMIARNNYASEHELFNGNIVMVHSCAPDDEVESRTVSVKIGKGMTENVELRFRKAVLKFRSAKQPVSVNVTLLDNFLDEPNSSISSLVARALVIDFERRIPPAMREQLSHIKTMLRKDIPLSPQQQEIYDAYIRLLWGDPFYNAVVCKYGYAVTCHKSQGGEWSNVFVDMCRYGGMANEDYFRWAYTAITRASKKLWHYRSPEFNYISNLVVESVSKSENIKVSTYTDGTDFRQARFDWIKELSKKYGISVSEDVSVDFQHKISFSDSDNHTTTYSLWYNKKGYSNKDILLYSSSDDLTATSRSILDASYAPASVPFSSPDRPFAEKLAAFMKTQLEELSIQLLDITREQYQDVFHVKTDGYAKICLYYTDKGNYTYMRLISSLGQNDEKLEALRQRFL